MLEARGLSMTLAGRAVLSGIDLAVARGEVVVLIGPNGAGKSTLLACLSGALRPTAGAVRIDGEDPSALGPRRLAIARAVLEQTPSIAVPFTLDELVCLGIPRGIPPIEARRIAGRAMAALGLAGLRRRPVTRLSGGERHRAHMARALAQLAAGRALGSGRWLLLDEPTASLDIAHQKAVLDAAREAASEGAGVLFVLHDLTLAAAAADRIVLMQRGRIAAAGPVRAIMNREHLSPVYGMDLSITEPMPGTLAIAPLFRRTSEGADDVCRDEPVPCRQGQ